MSDIEEMMKMYKEVQENYIKALERENEELRKQKEKDSIKIEELEKRLLEERNSNYIKNIPQRSPFDDRTVIGPGTGNGWDYNPNPVIYTANKTSPVTYKNDTTLNPTCIGSTAYSAEVDKFKKEYEKVRYFQTIMSKMQEKVEVEDDN